MRLAEVYKKYAGSTNLCLEGQTDKGPPSHSYLDFYDQVLYPFVGKKAVVLEMGVLKGGSLLLWREFLGDALVHGVDVRSCPDILKDKPGIFFHQLDCANQKALDESFQGMRFDVIIDDASHVLSRQVSSFNILYPRLNVGGLYVIEDVLVETLPGIRALNGGDVNVFDLRAALKRHDDIVAVVNKRC